MRRLRSSLWGFFLLAALHVSPRPPRHLTFTSSWRQTSSGRVARDAAHKHGSIRAQATRILWRSEAGWRRALRMLQELQPDRYDVSRMDWSWWQENIDNSSSKIDVTCQECSHRSCNTMLRSLQNGQSPGCFCNRGVRWSSSEGHARCLELLRSRYGERYDASCMDWSWWQENVCNASSKIDVTCQECGHRSRDTWLMSLQNGQSPGCFCNRGARWSSSEGHARCLELLRSRYGQRYDASCMDWSWWQENVCNASSKIDVTCQECGHRSRDTWLLSLQNGQSPGCFCNRGARWSSREGHARCLEMLRCRYGKKYDARRMDWSWWQENIDNATSKIDVTCQECGHRSRDTMLQSLQGGQSPGCLCSRKTEGKLMQWLLDSFASCTTQVPGCVNPKSQRSLPFDFGLSNGTILIELDGQIGHFGRGWGGAADDGGVPQRDLFKEQWALQEGKTVIRLLQEDVYRDSWNWKGFLTAAIQHAINDSVPCVLTQDALPYRNGIYRKLRRDIPCQVGNFQPTHDVGIPYLAYGAKRASVAWQAQTGR